MKESARDVIYGNLSTEPIVDISSCVDVAKEVAACNYEIGTCWGQEVQPLPHVYRMLLCSLIYYSICFINVIPYIHRLVGSMDH